MFYKKVADYCKENNLSIMAFEQKCGLTNGTVSKWKENGSPRLETLEKIVKATGVPVSKWLEQGGLMEYIYVLTNKATGRKYVGRSHYPDRRFREHTTALKSRRHANELMQYDFERFGIDSFGMEIIDSSINFTRTSLEGAWMIKLKTYDTRYGYNYKDPFFRHKNIYEIKNFPVEELTDGTIKEVK